MLSTSLPGGTWALGDLTVTRLGYGAMQLAGPGSWGRRPTATMRWRSCARLVRRCASLPGLGDSGSDRSDAVQGPASWSRRRMRYAVSAVLPTSAMARSYAARDSWLRPSRRSRSARVA